jgi:hypothetical protein
MEKPSLARHILPTSSTMVGVCLTAVGLVKIIEQHTGPSHVDEYFSLNSIIFLVSSVTAYLSLRSHAHHVKRYEAIADTMFIIGMVVMVVVTILFAYECI